MEPLTFETYTDGKQSGGRFVWGEGEERASIFERFYDAVELFERGDATRARTRLRGIIKKDPDFIDAYNSPGADFLERGKTKKALEYYEKAYAIGQRVLPDDFAGELLWSFLDNRPFLRTLHGLGLCYMRSKRGEEAIAIFECLLRYNPHDNQGIRYLLGDLYLAQHDMERADVYFAANCKEYPPYRYSYGASLFFQQRYIPAIIQFWLGLYENIYIAHAILRHPPLLAYQCYHASNFEMPETAQQYYSQTMNLWLGNEELKAFVDNIYRSPRVQMGIQALFECKQYLYYVRGDSKEQTAKRQEAFEYLRQLAQNVTEERAAFVQKDIELQQLL